MTLDIEKMYNTYFVKIYSYLMNIVKNPSAAEEITQETFAKAIISKNSYKGQSSEYTWLCAIAKNLAYDYFREEGRKTDLSDTTEFLVSNNTELDEVLIKGSSFSIHKILHEMEEPYKEVFELRVFGELSFAEIAKIFMKTESWARVTYHRARLKIKERLDSNEQ